MASTSESCLTDILLNILFKILYYFKLYCLKNYVSVSMLIYEAYWTYLLAQSLANFIPTLLFWNELIQFPVPKTGFNFKPNKASACQIWR